MKKIFAIVLTVLVLVGMCACNATPITETSTEHVVLVEPTTEPAELSTDPTTTEISTGWVFTGEYPEGGWEWTYIVVAPNGNKFRLPENGKILKEHNDRCLIQVGYDQQIWLCDQNVGLVKLSGDQQVLDYTVAYDTIYWFNLDRDVWAVDWYESSEPYLFCEDAIAVSHHTDEAEGAVVTWDRANIDYGYGLPIYSPYGE